MYRLGRKSMAAPLVMSVFTALALIGFTSLIITIDADTMGVEDGEAPTWTRIIPDTPIRAITVDPANPRLIYAGSPETGVYWSQDSGACFDQFNDGLLNTKVWALAADSRGCVYAGTFGGGVYKWCNEWNKWREVNGTNGVTLTRKIVYSLAIDSSDHVYAGTWDGIYKSTDGGAHWQQCGSIPKVTVLSLAGNPRGQIAIAGTWGGSIYRTNQLSACNDWAPISDPMFAYALAASTAAQIIYVGTANGIYQSVDGGMSWQHRNAGLGKNTMIYSLAIDPQITTWDRVYAGTDIGYHAYIPVVMAGSTPDRVASSKMVVSRFPLWNLIMLTSTPALRGIYVTDNGGQLWSPYDLQGHRILSLLINLEEQTSIYAGTFDGLWKSAPSSSQVACVTRASTLTPTVTSTPSPTPTLTPTVTSIPSPTPTLSPTPETAGICALVFEDANGNERRDNDEEFVPGARITAENSADDHIDICMTGEAERCCVDNLVPGEWLVREEDPIDYESITPNELRVIALAGTTIHVEFGDRRESPLVIAGPDRREDCRLIYAFDLEVRNRSDILVESVCLDATEDTVGGEPGYMAYPDFHPQCTNQISWRSPMNSHVEIHMKGEWMEEPFGTETKIVLRAQGYWRKDRPYRTRIPPAFKLLTLINACQ